MTKVRAKTTFYRSDIGIVHSGSVVEIPDDPAQELVEEKGFAEYAKSEPDKVEIGGARYAESFVQKDLPENFPHIEQIAEQFPDPTFRDLLEMDNIGNIKQVGESRKKEIKEGIERARKAYNG